MRAAALCLILLAPLWSSPPAAPERVGPSPGGGYLLSSGWRIQPAGQQVPLDTLPMSAALSPDGRYLLVLNGGHNPPLLSVLDVRATREVGRAPVPDAWLGLAFSAKGDRLWASGGSQAALFEFAFAQGKLTSARVFPVVAPEKRTEGDFIGDVTLAPDGRLLYAADLYRDAIVVINPQTGVVIERYRTGRRPYRILFHPDGKSFFVSSWTDGAVYHHHADDGRLIEKVRLGPHTTDMIWLPGAPAAAEEGGPRWVARLLVAAANTNNVYVVGVAANKEVRLIEVLNVTMLPRQPAGMTPSALAASADGKRLFVVCSDANAVAVVDVSEAPSRVMGYLPTGWYPTAARVLPDGRLVVLNGIRSGAASFIAPFTAEELGRHTRTVYAGSPYRDSKLDDAGSPSGNPIPAWPGDPTPLQHVVYVVKGNAAYDQVFGDLKEGRGEAARVRFGEQVAPNHRKLAREFVLFDNFYANSAASAEGYYWSTAAIVPDYVQRLWPNRSRRRLPHDYAGQEPAAVPPAGYLWTNAAAAGVTMRNYGHLVTNRMTASPKGLQIEAVRDSVLSRVTNLRYRGADPDYPDVERAKVFLRDLAEFEKTGQLPRLILLRLGNEHASGTAAAFADHDYALGMIIEALTKSRFWPKMAIFVVEASAQAGSDQPDSHHSIALVISPYARRRAVDSAMYNTTAVLRTMELVLGLQPMTHFDAAARPLWAAFQATPDARPYAAEKPRLAPAGQAPGSVKP